MTFRTLIVLGSSLTALAVVRAGRRKGLRCLMLDDQAGPASTTSAAEFRRLAAHDLASITEATDRLSIAAGIAVVADSDRWLRFVRDHGAALAAQGWLVLHPGAATIDTCLDKSAFLKWCSSNRLAAPRWYDATKPDAIGPDAYPLMLRPEWTQHSSGAGLPKAIEIRDSRQLAYWLDRFAAVHVEPSLCESLLRDGLRQFSVAAARARDGTLSTFVAEKLRPQADQCAGGTFVVPEKHEDAERLATDALRKLDFFGIAEVEVLFDPAERRAYLVEINARPWLQYGLAYACGHDFLAHLLGASGDGAPRRSGSHAWLYFSSDLYACFARSDGLVRRRRIGVAHYLRSLLAADVYAVWDWRDPGPALRSTARTAIAALKGLLRRG